MQAGAITGYFDVAQITLYAFWLFFAGLIFYLRREDKREGYPLESDRSGQVTVQGLPELPRPKIFYRPHGGTQMAPRPEPFQEVNGVPTANFPGAPLEPLGHPMLSGVGPAAYAQRPDEPELTFDPPRPKFVPMRSSTDHVLEWRDADPRGMPVVGADGVTAGTVRDIWIDLTETMIRFLEVEAAGTAGPRTIMLPANFFTINKRRGEVRVRHAIAADIVQAPATARDDQITMLEEDKLVAFFGSGDMYSTGRRMGPVL